MAFMSGLQAAMAGSFTGQQMDLGLQSQQLQVQQQKAQLAEQQQQRALQSQNYAMNQYKLQDMAAQSKYQTDLASMMNQPDMQALQKSVAGAQGTQAQLGILQQQYKLAVSDKDSAQANALLAQMAQVQTVGLQHTKDQLDIRAKQATLGGETAGAYQADPSPQNRQVLAAAGTAMGMQPPKPTDPPQAWQKYAAAVSAASVPAKDKIRLQQEAAAQATRTQHDKVIEYNAQQRLALAQASAARAASGKTLGEQLKIATFGEHMSNDLAKATSTYTKDLGNITQAKDLLEQDTPAADKQLQGFLAGMFTGPKGRATSIMYKDNANFGNLESKLVGFISKGFQGTYSQHQRDEIRSMLDAMQNQVIYPTLKSQEQIYKRRADKAAPGSGDLVTLPVDIPDTSAPSVPAGALPAGWSVKEH